MRLHFGAATFSVLLVWGSPAIGRAQEVPARASQPLFGAPDPRQSPYEALNGGLMASGTLFGAYDDNLLLTDSGLYAPPRLPVFGGTYAGYTGNLAYDWLGDTLAVRADLSTTGRYYPAYDVFRLGRQLGSVSLTAAGMSPWRGAHLNTNGAVQYRSHGVPFTAATFLPDDALDVGAIAGEISSYRSGLVSGAIQLGQDWGRRRSLSVTASVQSTWLENYARTAGYELGGMYSAKVGRHGVFRAGYSREAFDRGVGSYVIHNVTAGGNYARPLSALRGAYVSFGGGTSAIEGRGTFRTTAVGDAGFRYEFKRSWTASAHYHRGFTFVDEVLQPLMANTFVGSVDGLLSPRLGLLVSSVTTLGNVGAIDTASNYDMHGMRARLRYSLSRRAAIQGEYLFYHYRFDDSIHLAQNLPSTFHRQVALVSITFLTRLID